MLVDDIEGAKPKIKRVLETRDHYKVDDIEGARPKPALNRKVLHDQTYGDVTAKKMLIRSEPFNPLEPVFKTRDENGNLIEMGQVLGSKKAPAYFRTKKEDCERYIATNDIAGC